MIVFFCVIVYVSEVILGFFMDYVDDFVRVVICFNFEVGVMGVFFYDGFCFFQYIEGLEDSINVVYSCIFSVCSYCELIELGRGRVFGWFFFYWLMWLLWVQGFDIWDVVYGNWDGLFCGGVLCQLSLVVVLYLG